MGDLSVFERIHLVGVGGAGMSALARLLAGLGRTVTGSDLRGSETLAALADLGLEVWSGHRPERAEASDLVVASSAVPEDDPELAASRSAGVPVWRRPELLEAITASVPTIGSTGTHGKTSTTAMLVAALRHVGRDPSFVVGGEVLDLGTNAVAGSDDLLVLEVDEAFRTFEQVHLKGLVVTNVEPEHLDHFEGVDDLEEAFVGVVRRVDGPVVLCGDDPGSARIAERTGDPTYGTDPGADWRIHDPVLGARSVRFRLVGPGLDIEVVVARPGLHMARNAAGALALLARLDVDVEAAAEGLSEFSGVRRRFEHRGTVEGVTLVDDYAHHPTEISATLRAAARAGADRIWAVFQPHLYSRTELLHRDLGAALAVADVVVVTDVYGSRETPRPGVTGELVADAAIRSGAPEVHYVPHRAELAAFVVPRLRPGDLVITMGAGDVTVTATEILTGLAEPRP